LKSSIKVQLLAVLAVLGVTLFLTNVAAWWGQTRASASLETIYNDRVVPLRDLKDISDAYAVSIVDATHKVRSREFSWLEGAQAVSSASTRIDKLWRSYTATFLTEEESRLVSEAQALMRTADEGVTDLSRILKTEDQAALDSFVTTRLYPAIDPITNVIASLIELQVKQVEVEHGSTVAAFQFSTVLSVLLALLGVVAIIGGTVLLQRRVIRPIAELTEAMDKLARGVWQVLVPATERNDEIGQMARSVEVFKKNGVENEALQAEQVKQQQTRLQRAERTNAIVGDFNSVVSAIVRTLSSASSELQTTAQAMSSQAAETCSQAATVAVASEQASANVQAVAAAGEELSSSISEISRQVSLSAAAASRAVEEAESANAHVTGLIEAANEIGAVVRLISEIAGQTNLLALNATIESARAGEAGRGFAVVAAEVKALAKQTADATEEISSRISEIQVVSQRSAEAIKRISTVIAEVSEVSSAIASAVHEQGAATEEIARNVMEAATGTREVSSNISGVTEATQTTGASSARTLNSAKELARQSEELRQHVDAFIQQLKAA
jgi:methyl-accepting chemotaxis protein